jgi:hypothetical protein
MSKSVGLVCFPEEETSIQQVTGCSVGWWGSQIGNSDLPKNRAGS